MSVTNLSEYRAAKVRKIIQEWEDQYQEWRAVIQEENRICREYLKDLDDPKGAA